MIVKILKEKLVNRIKMYYEIAAIHLLMIVYLNPSGYEHSFFFY